MINDVWPREEDDHIEFGTSGWVPTKEGFTNKDTGQTKDKDGKVFDESGNVVFDPDEAN